MKSKQRFLLFALLALAAALAAGAAVGYVILAKPQAPGIYLTQGGLNYVKISGVGLETVETIAPEGRPISARAIIGPENQLRLDYDYLYKDLGVPDPIRGFVELVPSSKTRGDWSLTRFKLPWEGGNDEPAPLNRPLESFLHRVDDPRIPAYFKAQYEAKDPARAFVLAESLLRERPKDLKVRALFLNAALKNKDFARLAQELEPYRQAYLESEDPWLARIPPMADFALRVHAWERAGGTGGSAASEIMRGPSDLQTWLRRMPGVLSYEKLVEAPRDLNPDFDRDQFLMDQVLAKVAQVMATFWLMEGRRREAELLLLACYHYGQGMSESAWLIDRLVGVAIRSITLESMNLFALNACETPEQTREFFNSLRRWENAPGLVDDACFVRSVSPFHSLDGSFTGGVEAITRSQAALAKYRLLLAALAAKYQRQTSGVFPASPAEFGLLRELPADPFGSGPLRFIPGEQEFVIYSVGPDGADDLAMITYDPTNGIATAARKSSAGDIIISVPRERRYPFPQEGTRARTPEDVARQYPNGLPPDPFAFTRNRPLGITLDADGTVAIYSFGPDSDENSRTYYTSSDSLTVLEPMYDPTNGATSNGDIFVRLAPGPNR